MRRGIASRTRTPPVSARQGEVLSNSTAARLLIVDDEAPLMTALCDTLDAEGYVATGFTSAASALAKLGEEQFDILLTDLMMPEMDGIALLRAAQRIDRDLAGVVMTGHGTISTAVGALQAGAVDYVLKPFRLDNLLPVLTRALATRRLQTENIRLREAVSIYQLSRAITTGLAREEVVQRTLEAAAQQDDAGAVCIFMVNEDGTELQVAASHGCPEGTREDRCFPMDAPLAHWVTSVREQLSTWDGSGPMESVYDHPLRNHSGRGNFGQCTSAADALGPVIPGPDIRGPDASGLGIPRSDIPSQDITWLDASGRENLGGAALPMVANGHFYGVLNFIPPAPRRRLSAGQVKALDILASTAASAFEAASLLQQLRLMNRELEERVRDRTRDLEASNADLEAFSYSVSHDLRSPLHAIDGFCEILMTDYSADLPAAAQTLLAKVRAGATRMHRLIDDLLHLARFSRQPLQTRHVRMNSLVKRVAASFEGQTSARDVKLIIADLPDCHSDGSLLEHVFVNLLSNAFKFTGGRKNARIEIGALHRAAEQVYFVRDNGVGFDMQHADKLFGVFQRFHSQSEFPGTGIGLSIVQRIVRRHGGRAWAESRPQEGSTFYFSVPIVTSSAPAQLALAHSP